MVREQGAQATTKSAWTPDGRPAVEIEAEPSTRRERT
jgi:hypothetical protein